VRRFIAAFIATVAGVVLLLSFKIAPTKSAAQPLASSAAPDSTAPDSSVPAQATPAPATTGTRTVTGSTVTAGERGQVFGQVQVRLTITGGKITAVSELQYPNNDPRSSQISQFAIPTLRGETLSAQSARIDSVSGATYTSAAYAQSVQAALDQAKS
jgi:uncharacterized protein with FMN-binding domain